MRCRSTVDAHRSPSLFYLWPSVSLNRPNAVPIHSGRAPKSNRRASRDRSLQPPPFPRSALPSIRSIPVCRYLYLAAPYAKL